MSLLNADYHAEVERMTSAERAQRRVQEKERRKILESYRDYQLVDADQHYYEPDDCFTRHLESKYREYAIEVRREGSDGTGRTYVAGKPFRHLVSPVSDKASPPGAMREYFKSEGHSGSKGEEPTNGLTVPEYVDKRTRLAALDAMAVEATLMLPTLGLVVETECTHLPREAWYALMRSFNRWLEEDWGYGSDGRIFGAPLVSLLDPDLAVKEIDRLIEADARIVLLRSGPVFGRSPADPIFDPFWARIQEANVLLGIHLGEPGYLDFFAPAWGYGKNICPAGAGDPFEALTCSTERPAMDTVAALILGGLFDRFPQLRVLLLELGASWVPGLLKKMDLLTRKSRSADRPGVKISDEPSAIYNRHFWITPYHEDPWTDLIQSLGASRLLLGSDWPHVEGVPEPLDMLDDIGLVSSVELRLILRDNTASLLGLTR